jgi:hypothetical protein
MSRIHSVHCTLAIGVKRFTSLNASCNCSSTYGSQALVMVTFFARKRPNVIAGLMCPPENIKTGIPKLNYIVTETALETRCKTLV